MMWSGELGLLPDFPSSVCVKEVRRLCVSAWNKDPVFGVIGIQSGL
ncbi:hypothetical protein ACVWXL_009067 [Bradyrhizobium sp. GM22.5]